MSNVIATHYTIYSSTINKFSPFKKKQSLLDNYQRLEMVFRATEDYDKLQPSDIEFSLPQPIYTVNTLAHLQERYPHHEFSLIMGEDNLKSFHKRKNYQVILYNHDIYVYPRISEDPIETQFDNHKRIHHVHAPIIELSSTFIRQSIKNGINVKPRLPQNRLAVY